MVFHRWLYIHWAIQFLIAGPVIYAGWALGYDLAGDLDYPQFKVDKHQTIGLALLVLYLVQLVLGFVVHFFKFHSIFRGYRAPHNYLHIFIGLAIIALSVYQVRSFMPYNGRTAFLTCHVVMRARFIMVYIMNGMMLLVDIMKYRCRLNVHGWH